MSRLPRRHVFFMLVYMADILNEMQEDPRIYRLGFWYSDPQGSKHSEFMARKRYVQGVWAFNATQLSEAIGQSFDRPDLEEDQVAWGQA